MEEKIVVLKFGGTSVGSPERMSEVLEILEKTPGRLIIVLSAMSGTTNSLEGICALHSKRSRNDAQEETVKLKNRYEHVAKQLFKNSEILNNVEAYVSRVFEEISLVCRLPWSVSNEKMVLAQGELLSTYIFQKLCESKGKSTILLSALEFMQIDENGEPDLLLIENKLKANLGPHEDARIVITQGYICRNYLGETDNLKRGGSDYTATIIGGVLKASEIQIWTDIDGVHNNDPRIVEGTYPIRQLSYREAAELAYFGAKILHPTCVLPAERMGVPLRLKYTMEPDSEGTLISKLASARAITAIAAKDQITAIKIYSHRMLMAYGFLKKVFQIFEDFETPIDMIATSEVAVSLTIDYNKYLEGIKAALAEFSEVETDSGYTIICIVGNELYDQAGYVDHIFSCLNDIPVRMVSMGGSRYNISLLIKTEYKEKALRQLNEIFAII